VRLGSFTRNERPPRCRHSKSSTRDPAHYVNGGAWELVAEFIETKTGKGADALARRPQLRAAMDACRKSGAKLLIAKLDRLARNVHFVTGLMVASKGNGKTRSSS
jgi:DNA invertase Pin-like site-specific DNA recombinase